MWFEKLTGFKEENPDQVRSLLEIRGDSIISAVNNKSYIFGRLEVPSLEDLRNKSISIKNYDSNIIVEEVVGDIQAFHLDKSNNGATFQAASQFNLLEMVGPEITPEQGVDIYEHDHTQGPACAVACGAGTIYRNYFANVNGFLGQSSKSQIDCLSDIGIVLNNNKLNLWKMSNGYVLTDEIALINISQQIRKKSRNEYDQLKSKLRVGIQEDTEVTIGGSKNLVTQVYCSALPINYSNISSEYWKDFAKLILFATYEATFYASFLNYIRTCDTPDPPGHFRLNSKGIKGGCDAQRSKRGTKT